MNELFSNKEKIGILETLGYKVKPKVVFYSRCDRWDDVDKVEVKYNAVYQNGKCFDYDETTYSNHYHFNEWTDVDRVFGAVVKQALKKLIFEKNKI